jgi:DNA-binding transcriptional LysR family regulator
VTLAQLEAFVAAAATQTFTAAAVRMGVTQPAMSDLIRRLEGELEATLFRRSGRRLVLSPAGEQLLPHAQRALRSASRGFESVRDLATLTEGTATLGVLRNADFYLGTDLARDFRRMHPGVKIRLVGQNSTETVRSVLDGSLEAGLVTLPLDDDRLEVLPLGFDEVLYVTADVARTASAPTMEDICRNRLVLYDAHFGNADPARRQLADRAAERGLSFEASIEVEYLSTAMSLVADGFGDTIICRAAVAREVVVRGLSAISLAEPMFDTLALVKRRGQSLSPATRELARSAYRALVACQSSPIGTVAMIDAADAVEAFLT